MNVVEKKKKEIKLGVGVMLAQFDKDNAADVAELKKLIEIK